MDCRDHLFYRNIDDYELISYLVRYANVDDIDYNDCKFSFEYWPSRAYGVLFLRDALRHFTQLDLAHSEHDSTNLANNVNDLSNLANDAHSDITAKHEVVK